MGRRMEAISSVLDALAWPVFPAEPWPQAAFVSVAVLLLVGVAMLAFPVTCGRVLGLDSAAARPGGIGEIRPTGGFLGGYALATLMFFDQPVLCAGFGVAMAVAGFARMISLMSDISASLLNVLIFLVQLIFAVAMLYYFGQAITNELQLGVPTELMPQIVFFVFAAFAVVGFLVLFAPRIAMGAAGLWVLADKQGGIASVRSTGGFMLGLGLFGMAVAGYWQSQFVVLLMLCFGVIVALVLSVIGRLLALVLNRGNLVFNAIALFVQIAATILMISYVGGAM
jgi:hypothetical protein